MKNNSDVSNLFAVAFGAFLILPFVLVYWAFAGDKDWKRILGILFTFVWIICLIFNPS